MENIYQDIACRSDGDIYIGVVGPVRTGKSTFIKKFMDLKVLPNIDNEFKRERAKDEMPQSASGKTIMTTEPKFIPNEAVTVSIDRAKCRVKLIDCVGYMVKGALGSDEDGKIRMVKTPWNNEPVAFDTAAEIGTKKVISDHSTIGLVVTTDGSITDIPREDYIEAEERVISELKTINKPFVVLLNCINPGTAAVKSLQKQLSEKYEIPVKAVSCENLDEDELSEIMESVLYEFPLREIGIKLPKWVDALEYTHPLKEKIYESLRNELQNVNKLREAKTAIENLINRDYVKNVTIDDMDLSTGEIKAEIATPDELFYEILSSNTGFDISGEDTLLTLLTELKEIKHKYDKIEYALKEVDAKGYGIVSPTLDELSLEEPEIVKQGGRFGVKLKASAPSIHMIKATIETEVNPIVGTEKESEELVQYLLNEFETDPKKIWNSNIFGKSLHELVNSGLNNKLSRMPDESRFKLQETLQRIINEGSGGLICIIL